MHCVSIGTFSVSIRDLKNITFTDFELHLPECSPVG